MSQIQPDGSLPGWLAWVAGSLGATVLATAIAAVAKRFFSTVTRLELVEIVDRLTEAGERRATTLEGISKKLGEVEQRLARLEGELSGRFRSMGGN